MHRREEDFQLQGRAEAGVWVGGAKCYVYCGRRGAPRAVCPGARWADAHLHFHVVLVEGVGPGALVRAMHVSAGLAGERMRTWMDIMDGWRAWM